MSYVEMSCKRNKAKKENMTFQVQMGPFVIMIILPGTFFKVFLRNVVIILC